jgi:hypothetical protein
VAELASERKRLQDELLANNEKIKALMARSGNGPPNPADRREIESLNSKSQRLMIEIEGVTSKLSQQSELHAGADREERSRVPGPDEIRDMKPR